MAKPTGGLMALDARGQLGKTLVYSTWRGRNYVRRLVIPANPQTTAQTETRGVFAWLQATWKIAPTGAQTPWTAAAKGRPLTDRNLFGKANIAVLRTATTLAGFVFSPGANAGLAAASITVTPGATQLTVTATAPTAPTGWTLASMELAVLLDADPHVEAAGTIQVANVAAPGPYTHVFTGLTTASLYRASAWPVWTKPDLTTAYGPGLNGSGTPT